MIALLCFGPMLLSPGPAVAAPGLVSAIGSDFAGAAFAEQGALVVGGEPKYLLSDPIGNRLYVSDWRAGEVAVVDLERGVVSRRIPVSGRPAGLALDASRDRLFVALYDRGQVVRLNLAKGTCEATAPGLGAPWDLKLVNGPGGTPLLAVTEHHGDSLLFLDPDSLGEVASLETGYYPYQMDVDGQRGRLYVVSYGGRSGGLLQAVDLSSLTEIWHGPTGKGSHDVRVDPASGRIMVTDFVGDNLTRYAADGRWIGSSPVGARPRGAAFSGDGRSLFVALQGAGLVKELDPGTGVSRAAIPVGARPGAIAWLDQAATTTLAAANQGDGTVSLLSAGPGLPDFTDVGPGHLFHREIRVLALRGSLNGYPEGNGRASFRPDATLARAQLVKILVGSLGVHTGVVDVRPARFRDVPADGTSYPYDYVEEAARLGIVTGWGGFPPLFGPYEPVTRMQLVRMVVRAAEALGSPLPSASGSSPFYDVSSANPDFPAVMAAYSSGLVAGSRGGDGRLRLEPYALATRGQTARLIFNLLAAFHRRSVTAGR